MPKKLIQAGAAESFHIVVPVGVALDRHMRCDPGKRNIGLDAPKFLQGGSGDGLFSSHARRGGQDPVGADKIAALPDSLARKPHGLFVIARDELSICGYPVINR